MLHINPIFKTLLGLYSNKEVVINAMLSNYVDIDVKW